jgi:hypothetical protein
MHRVVRNDEKADTQPALDGDHDRCSEEAAGHRPVDQEDRRDMDRHPGGDDEACQQQSCRDIPPVTLS